MYFCKTVKTKQLSLIDTYNIERFIFISNYSLFKFEIFTQSQ